MSLILTQSMILTPAEAQYDERRLNGPVIGYENLVQFGGISATSENVNYPAINLANPSTYLTWRSQTAGAQSITFSLSDFLSIDYVGLARHNLGSLTTQLTLEYRVGTTEVFQPLTNQLILPNDNPTIIRFDARDAAQVRLTLEGSNDIPEIAVIYIGKLLQLQRNIYVGHTPINLGRRTRVATGRSESGNFLGRIISTRGKQTSVSLKNLTPEWYRARMEPFVQAAEEKPFFFAWRPDDYPREIGFAWTTDDVVPVNQLPNGMMSVDLNLAGIAGDGDILVRG